MIKDSRFQISNFKISDFRFLIDLTALNTAYFYAKQYQPAEVFFYSPAFQAPPHEGEKKIQDKPFSLSWI